MPAKTQYFQNCLGVFQGGGCRGTAFVGAYHEAIARGVSFSELVGTSAGSIVAVFIAAGATPDQLAEILSRLDFTQLLSEPTPIPNIDKINGLALLKPFKKKKVYNLIAQLGMHGSDQLTVWVDTELKKLLGLSRTVLFSDLIIPVSIVVSDLQAKTVKLYSSENDKDEEVAAAVRKSCNIPFFFQPIDKRYVDGGILSNIPSFVFKDRQSSSFERILAFTLKGTEDTHTEIRNIVQYIKLLATTAIDGSLDLQMDLQKNVHVIPIPTGKIQATDFDTITKEDKEFLIEMGRKHTQEFFDKEVLNIQSEYQRNDVFKDFFRTYNEVVHSLSGKVVEVIVSDANTKWVYELFPTLVGWVLQKARIVVFLKANNDDARHTDFRQRILHEMGCEVRIVQDLPFQGFVINGHDHLSQSKAIVYNENDGEEAPFHSKLYYGQEDLRVITLLRDSCAIAGAAPPSPNLELRPIEPNTLFTALQNIPQYNKAGVTFELAEVNIADFVYVTRYVRGYKYRQVNQLFDLFRINNVPFFKPAKIVFPSGKESLVTPPVVEEHGGRYHVIEGNTRLTFALRNGMTKMWCVIVHGVSDPIPSSGRFTYNWMLITDKETVGKDRFENFNQTHFRQIERGVRPPDTTLI